MATRKIEVLLVGDASSLEKAFGKAGRSAGGFQSAIGKASKVAGVALVGLGVAAKLGFDELQEAQLVGAQTGAVLKSTGGAAKVTAKDVEGLAGALSHMSGVDDEAIQSGENMLLTFTRIRNEVGKGNDIFDQATTATLNLSVAMGKDMQSSAILVGKALNDPLKGMSALSRAGIQFTDAQKESIKAMVESGDVMGAQKLMLKELETQFGGSAKAAGQTLTGSINKAKNAAAEMAAGLVAALLPTITRLTQLVVTASKWMTEHQQVVKIGAVALTGLATAVLAVNAALKLYSAATVIATVVTRLLGITMLGIPVVAIAAGIIALGAALVLAYTKSETFREIVNAVFNAVRNTAATVIAFILTALDKFMGGIQKAAEVASKLPFVGDKFKGVAEAVGNARDKVRDLRDGIEGLKSKEITVTTNLVVRRTEVASALLPDRRAAGGPVLAHRPYIVGERGPELMVPGRSGMVVPNGTLRGGGGNVFHFSFPNYVGSREELARIVTGAVVRANRRGSLALADLT